MYSVDCGHLWFFQVHRYSTLSPGFKLHDIWSIEYPNWTTIVNQLNSTGIHSNIPNTELIRNQLRHNDVSLSIHILLLDYNQKPIDNIPYTLISIYRPIIEKQYSNFIATRPCHVLCLIQQHSIIQY